MSIILGSSNLLFARGRVIKSIFLYVTSYQIENAIFRSRSPRFLSRIIRLNLLLAFFQQPNTIRVSSFESVQRFEALESKSNHFRRETSTNPFSPIRFPKGKADFQWQKSEVVVFGPSRPADVNTIGKSAVVHYNMDRCTSVCISCGHITCYACHSLFPISRTP